MSFDRRLSFCSDTLALQGVTDPTKTKKNVDTFHRRQLKGQSTFGPPTGKTGLKRAGHHKDHKLDIRKLTTGANLDGYFIVAACFACRATGARATCDGSLLLELQAMLRHGYNSGSGSPQQ